MCRVPHGGTGEFAGADRGNVVTVASDTTGRAPAGRLRRHRGLQTDQSHEPPYVAVAAEQSPPGFPNTMSAC